MQPSKSKPFVGHKTSSGSNISVIIPLFYKYEFLMFKKIFMIFLCIIAMNINIEAKISLKPVQSATTPDPNFHIYICFGQSNMEGAAPLTDSDKINVNPRFRVMTVSSDDYLHDQRIAGQWYAAIPPLCRWDTGLTPADYFGKTLVEHLSDNIKVGVIVIAMGGSGIDAFDKDNYTQYYQNADAWQKGLMNIYGGNPYAKLIEMAKFAQQSGVIKGILLHQGETNNGQQDWPLKVKKIYYDMLHDLNIVPNSIPLLAGEMLQQNQGGICWGMNSIITKLPEYIPNSYLISSVDCTGKDNFHFTNAGQKELGTRYGTQMLSLLDTISTIEGQTVDHLFIESNSIVLLTGTSKKVPLKAVYIDGHTRDISYLADYSISNPDIIKVENGIINALKDGESIITANYKGSMGETKQIYFNAKISTFPLTNTIFNPRIWQTGNFEEQTRTLQTGQWGFGGWQYQGIDLSGYKYLVAQLGSDNQADVSFKIFDGNSYWGAATAYPFGNNHQIIIDLNNATKSDGSKLNPAHIYIAGFWSNGNKPFVIDNVFLSNSTPNELSVGFERVQLDIKVVSTNYFSINGLKIKDISKLNGIFIVKELFENGTIRTLKSIKNNYNR